MLKKNILRTAIAAMIIGSASMSAQTLEIEDVRTLESLKIDSYLGNVEYNETDKTTILHYVEKDVLNTTFVSYYFDENLRYVKEETSSYNLIDKAKSVLDEVKTLHTWFNYTGESYSREYIDIAQGWGGKIVASRQIVTFNFSWSLGMYIPSYAKQQKIEIKGETEDKIYLYDHIVNTQLGET